MTTNQINPTAKYQAHIAGLLYLLIIFCGLFSEMFVRQSLIVPGDAATTSANILSAPFLFRMGFASDLVMVICDIAVGVTFYVLLRHVSKGLALLAAFFRLAQAAIIGMNLLNHLTTLTVLQDPVYTSAMTTTQVQAQAMLLLNMHANGYLISGVFFGMSCGVLGYLFYKSRLFPKALGIMMMLACGSYLADCFTNFLAPQYADTTEIILLVTAVTTEFAVCIYLLIKGIKKK